MVDLVAQMLNLEVLTLAVEVAVHGRLPELAHLKQVAVRGVPAL